MEQSGLKATIKCSKFALSPYGMRLQRPECSVRSFGSRCKRCGRTRGDRSGHRRRRGGVEEQLMNACFVFFPRTFFPLLSIVLT